jgi:hypothetical protein
MVALAWAVIDRLLETNVLTASGTVKEANSNNPH